MLFDCFSNTNGCKLTLTGASRTEQVNSQLVLMIILDIARIMTQLMLYTSYVLVIGAERYIQLLLCRHLYRCSGGPNH